MAFSVVGNGVVEGHQERQRPLQAQYMIHQNMQEYKVVNFDPKDSILEEFGDNMPSDGLLRASPLWSENQVALSHSGRLP